MTQLRAPLTFPAAMTRVAGVLGWPTCAKMARRSARAVRYWSEDGCTATPTIAQALAYDAAYQAAGGEGAPFADAFVFQLQGARAQVDACRRQLADAIAKASSESGDAIAAGVALTVTNASPVQALRALAEAEEAHSAWGRVIRRLTSFLPTSAGNTGGASQ
ncbi:hypothetical protein [Sphingomonas melonis]|uniref:hypothetical protein n=1 Tax=Sphingomonas melonis TaxID=152682 RepID=UPI0035C7E78F